MNLLIVSLADASAEPDTVVVELHDAIIANVAVRGARRPEYTAGLAVFELKKHGRVHEADLEVVDAVLLPIVLLVDLAALHGAPGTGWNDSGFA